MGNFNVGDTVICISDEDSNFPKKGKKYKVATIEYDSTHITLCERYYRGNSSTYSVKRFEVCND